MSDFASTRAGDLARKPRRLCMVVHSYYPIGEPRVEREAKAAAQAGYLVDVVCLRQPRELSREVVDGIEVHRVGVTHNRGAGLVKLLREYLAFAVRASIVTARLRHRDRETSEHVVQVHAPPDFLIGAGIVPKLLGSSLIVDIHDLSTHLYGARFGGPKAAGWLVNLLLRLIERGSCAIADQVITVHEPYRRELISHGVRDSSVTVVMNAADESLIGRAKNGKIPRSPGASFTLAYHGTITPGYGVDLIVEALPRILERVPDIRCVILGEGDALPAIKARAADLGVAHLIEFSGRYVPIDVALGAVAKADCGVIPNRPSEYNRFALSSKLFEYVALGVPAVVARLETLASHFSPDEVSFFKAGDAGSLASAITWVALNPSDANARATRALARSREYSWTEQRARYLGVIGPRPREASVRDGRARPLIPNAN